MAGEKLRNGRLLTPGLAVLDQQVEEAIMRRGLILTGERILVAVSGGADSMTLLGILRRITAPHRWKLTIAHFNHQLRGLDSDGDEHLVQTVSAEAGLPFRAGRSDVKAYAIKHSLSLEMAARQLRHEFLAVTAHGEGISTVLLAHHADDQCELFLLRLLRGAGTDGLAGMKWASPSPVSSKVRLVRPLLETSRADILAYAHHEGIAFRTDHTNSLSDIPRNKIRNELIPFLEQNYQSTLRSTISRQMEILGDEATLIDELARVWLQKAERSPFYALHRAMQRRTLILQLRQLGVLVRFDLVESLRITECVPVMVSPGRVVSRDAYGLVKMEQIAALAFEPGEIQINLSAESGSGKLDAVKFRWVLLRGAGGAAASVPDKKKGCEYFDAAKIGSIITVRHWRAGDRFQPIGMAQAVRVQDLFVNAKIPREERRRRIMAVAANGEIAWVEGLRISERFKLDKQTSDKLKWEWQRRA